MTIEGTNQMMRITYMQTTLRRSLMQCLGIAGFVMLWLFGLQGIVAGQDLNDTWHGHQVRATIDRGVWIDDGLVGVGENVHMTVALPGDQSIHKLPPVLVIHPRYLEDPTATVEAIRLKWEKSQDGARWSAVVDYQPQRAGNYYAAIQDENRECFAYFAAWKPGLTVTTFWVFMAAEYHAMGNLADLYLPEIRAGHLPFDYELALVGEQVFKDDWEPRPRFREAQEETGADVIPFFDGGYFHKLDPQFTKRFEDVTQKMSPDADGVSRETYAFRDRMLPDPTFHGLTIEQCESLINGARRYWKRWGFRDFTGISTYSPSHLLVEACRRQGLPWISGVFQDYSLHDGRDRWLGSWVQEHSGMPSFPYIVSRDDYRRAGACDQQCTMMFPAQRNLPVWDYESFHWAAVDAQNFQGWTNTTMVKRMMDFADAYRRNDALCRYDFPYVISYCIQFPSYIQANRDVLNSLIERAGKGQTIFAHKRDIQEYFRKHNIQRSPDLTCGMPDGELTAGAPAPLTKGIQISYEAWWEGADGKAAFVSNNVPQLGFSQAPYLPIWWFDFRGKPTLSEKVNLPKEDLSSVTAEVIQDGEKKVLVIRSPRAIRGLPICLWNLSKGMKVDEAWIRKNRAMRVAAPKSQGQDATMWVIRPDVITGENRIAW
jgi:hypothetical protein